MRVELTSEWHKRHMASAVPGAAWDPDERAWVLDDPTPRAAAVALKMFPDLVREHPRLADLRDSLARDVRPFDNATPAGLSVAAPTVVDRLAREHKALYPYQDLDLGYVSACLETHGGAYIAWERGLGKTLASFALVESTGATSVLVVCPNTAKESVWRAEARRWLPDRRVIVLPNPKKHRDTTMQAVLALKKRGEDVILVVHYEALAIIAGRRETPTGRPALGDGWRKYGEWDLVVADEVHRIKDPTTKMAKALKKIPARHKVGLSGSVIQNHAEELFSPLQWLFPKAYKAKRRDWCDRFLDYVHNGFGEVCVGVKEHRLEELRQELGVFMVYRRKEDELDLPAKTEQTLFVDLSPAQRRAYDELVRQCETTLSDGTSYQAADGLVLLTRLRQVATGLDLLGGVADSTKLDLATDLVCDSPDEAFVVFSWYRAAAEALEARLTARGVECWRVDGSTKQALRGEVIERFQAGERRVFIGTIKTIGESVTLHRASQAIFLDRSWNPSDNIQAMDRIYRIGQSKPITVTWIVAQDTVDELKVTPTVANKEALRAMILGGT